MNRRLIGVLRLIAGLGLLATITVQIVDRAVNGAFDPWEYFSYFTIQTSLMNIAVLLAGAALAFRLDRDTVLFTVVRMTVLTYAIVTAGVYNLSAPILEIGWRRRFSRHLEDYLRGPAKFFQSRRPTRDSTDTFPNRHDSLHCFLPRHRTAYFGRPRR